MPPPPGSILAIDLGLRRTGLARSDPDRCVAFGLPTFELRPGRSLRQRLRDLHTEEPFTGVVLGLPLHMDGTPGDLAARVERLAAWIRAEFRVPVALLDERLTTCEAAEMLREAGRGVRREKGVRDRLAAQVLLREFLAAGCPFPPAASEDATDGAASEDATDGA